MGGDNVCLYLTQIFTSFGLALLYFRDRLEIMFSFEFSGLDLITSVACTQFSSKKIDKCDLESKLFCFEYM